MSDAKKVKSYRLGEEAIAEIKRVAKLSGESEGVVIELWAAESKSGIWGSGQVSKAEKKSGAAREVLHDDAMDIPDEVIDKAVKVRAPLPKLMRGSEVPEPVKKKVDVLELDGKITKASLVGPAGQIRDLAAARGVREPILRPGHKK